MRFDALNQVGGKIRSGRETRPSWEYGFYKQLNQPLRRGPYRDKKVIDALKLLRDLNPDASMAVWNFLRLANQGHEVEVFDINGDIDTAMQEYINDDLAPRLGRIYGGGMDQVVNVLNLTGYTQGAEAIEVELNESLDDIIDFHPLDPSRLDFVPNGETGELELCQKQEDGTYKKLNEEQVFYMPLDPDIDDPFGRSPMLPAIEAVMFQAQVLNDLKAVAHHQGLARFDISVSTQAIVDNLPEHILADEEQAKQAVANFMNGVEEAFDDLDPDDDFYHNDAITITTVGGTSGKSMDSKSLIDIINQQVVTSLKQLPILLGRNESTTETHGSIQWEIHIAGVRSIQKMTKRMLERAYTVALRVKGSQSSISISFDEVRTKDRAAEASAESVEIQNEIMKYQQGWIDNDEAANKIVGHDSVGNPITQTSSSSVNSYSNYLSQLTSKTNTTEGGDEDDEEGRSFRQFPSEIYLRGKSNH